MAKKYIDADLLRKAVEKQIDYAKGVYPKGSMEEARASAITAVYRNILASIDSLQQEQSSEDLEAEINRLWESFADEMEGPHNLYDIYARLARHFYELGKQAKKEN